jgi:hypothetical protein
VFPLSPLVLGAWGKGFGVPGRTFKLGPFNTPVASRRMVWRRCSCEVMNGAECRSPVQRVMSMLSRAELRRLRRWAS